MNNKSIGTSGVDNKTFRKLVRESTLVPIRDVLTDEIIHRAFQKARQRIQARNPAEKLPATRSRICDPVVTMLHFLQQAIGREASFASTIEKMLAKAVATLQGPVSLSASALCQARSRLPIEVFEELIATMANFSHNCPRWHGYRLLALDATTISMQARQALVEYFTKPKVGGGTASYPVGTLATLLALEPIQIVDYRFGPYDRGELCTARPVLESLSAGDLLMADRRYSGVAFLLDVMSRGADFLVRKHQCRKISSLEVVEQLGEDDFLCRIERGGADSVIRAFKAEWDAPNGRPLREWFFTSLKDTRFGKEQLARLYHLRWRQETSYLEFKEWFHGDVLRSHTVENAKKEMAAHVLCYQLVRRLIEEAAARSNAKPTQISVLQATRWLLAISPRMSMAAPRDLAGIYRTLLDQISLCRIVSRPGRSEPRLVVHDRRKYPRLRCTRQQWRNRYLKPPPQGRVPA